MSEVFQAEIVVIGAGAVGLAISAALSKDHDVIVVEANARNGQGISSRNSCVIHSGIYYPPQSKKTQWCIEGRDRLYAYCKQYGVGFNKCGKAVVSTSEEDDRYLDKLHQHATALGVPIEWRKKQSLESEIPFLSVRNGVFFPETGIVDVHGYMDKLESQTRSARGDILFRHRLADIARTVDGWRLSLEAAGVSCQVKSSVVINAAGLAAAEISNAALKTSKYEHRYCRGRYFFLGNRHQNRWPYLVYPTPEKHGVGIHVTLDMENRCRLGPDVDWCTPSKYSDHEKWYDCDWDALLPSFAAKVRRYAPSIQDSELTAGFIGIRPKLFIDGQSHTDFLVEKHDGFIQCLGIESPGITASLAIADEVKRLLEG